MSRASLRGFTLIEIMVVVVLLSVIILGLMAMFSETQRAFRAGMSQSDILEGGRMATEMISRELEQMYPANTAGTNFFKQVVSSYALPLPASAAARTNYMSAVFFLTLQNRTWQGIGYFWVPDNSVAAAGPVPVGTLYRFQTNLSILQFQQDPRRPLMAYNGAYSATYNNGYMGNGVSKLLDGVVDFNCRAFDTNGFLLNPYYFNPRISPFISTNQTQWSFYTPEANYSLTNNAVPAFVEFELGVMEQAAYQQYRSIPTYQAQGRFMSNQVGRIQIFRQRVAVRNVDPSAYQ